MKSKKTIKKLSLSKETVANLSGDQIKKIKGGTLETYQATACYQCTYPYRTCNGCNTAMCTVNTCDCPTETLTCWPEQCV